MFLKKKERGNAGKKRILIFIWNLGVGGVQKRVKDILKQVSLEHIDVKIYILVKFKEPNFYNKEIEGLKNVSVYYAPIKGSRKQGRLAFIGQFFFILWVWFKYLIILPHTILSFMNRLSAIMVIINKLTFFWSSRLIINEGVFTSDYLKIHSLCPELASKTLNFFYSKANKIIVPTQVIKKEFVDNYLLDGNKIVIVPNWTLFKPCSIKKKKYDLIFAGRFEKEKQPLELIEIVAHLTKDIPNLKMLFLGQGSLEQKMRLKIKQLDLKSVVEVKRAKKNIQDYYSLSKVLVLNSKNEGLPNVVIEAGMCGIPSVVNNFVGASEVIKHKKNGFIAKNKKEMNRYLKLLLENDKKRNQFGKAMQTYVQKNFSHEQQQKFINILLD
ncbi:MAG: glycosyltransferase [Patescibacteria group bacterium]|nr:glycosyltransferase [Patescibacteria group bacterium]